MGRKRKSTVGTYEGEKSPRKAQEGYRGGGRGQGEGSQNTKRGKDTGPERRRKDAYTKDKPLKV